MSTLSDSSQSNSPGGEPILSPAADRTTTDKAPAPAEKKKKRSRLAFLGFLSLWLIALLIVARLLAPSAVRWYVNRVIDRSPIYQGRIGAIELHLWRGAYSIYDIRLDKTTGNVPVPLYAAQRMEFSVEWKALLHRRLVGRVIMYEPQLNFVASNNDAESQSGAGGPWLQIITDLFPFKINSAHVDNGSIHFRTYQAAQPVDVYLSQMDASVDNLTNIHDETAPLITTVQATALAMDQAKFEYQMKLNPFSYNPTFHLTTRLIGLDVTKVNDLAMAYGQFDFKRGWFDLVVETDSKEGQLEGYIKPLFRNLKIFKLKQDLKEDNALQLFWQAMLGAVSQVLTNHNRDQIGTVIPFRADTSGNKPDVIATVGNLLRNAFVRAYLPKLEPSSSAGDEGLQFEPPSVSDPVTAGDTQNQ